MTKNKLKAKNNIIKAKAVGDVVQDILKMYYLMINQDNPIDPQILKNVIKLVEKSYSTELEGAPQPGIAVQRDLEELIDELKDKYNAEH